MIKIANAQLWVHDQDEALAFYTDKLGMEVRSDATLPELGNFRWLTVGPAGQPDISIVLMAIPGPPVMDAETAASSPRADGEGLRRHDLPHDRRLPGVLRAAQGTRRRIRRGARGAPVRDRLVLPRSLGQPLPPHAGAGAGDGLLARRIRPHRGVRRAGSPARASSRSAER